MMFVNFTNSIKLTEGKKSNKNSKTRQKKSRKNLKLLLLRNGKRIRGKMRKRKKLKMLKLLLPVRAHQLKRHHQNQLVKEEKMLINLN